MRGFEKRNSEPMLMRGMKRTRWIIRNKEIIEIRWKMVVKCFKG